MSGSLKRKSVAAVPDCTCAICLDPLGPTDATFKGPCQHVFHIQCAETNFVVGRRNTCPLCRCVFEHAPGAVAMARAGASMRTPATRLPEAPVMPDVPVPESLETDFAAARVSLDTQSIEAGERKLVTALLTVRYKDDTEADRREMPSDFVLLADVSGSSNVNKREDNKILDVLSYEPIVDFERAVLVKSSVAYETTGLGNWLARCVQNGQRFTIPHSNEVAPHFVVAFLDTIPLGEL